MSSSTSQINHSTPVSTTKVQMMLIESKLQPFDHNYTLTGLIKDIQTSINQLLKSKKQPQNQCQNNPQLQISILQKVQQQVGILKVIIAHNINSIFSSIYPSNMGSKSENSTNHRDSSKKRHDQEILNKSMTISDFNIEANNKINSLEISKESLAYYQKRYAEQKQNEEMLNEGKITIRVKNESIRIEEDEDGDKEEEEIMDLICHQDEKTIIINRRRNNVQETKEVHFSPIEQRPIEEEYSMQKGCMQQNKENQDRNLMFNPNRQNLYVKIIRNGEQVKKSLFSQKCQTFKRVSHRKFNYLQQLNKY